MKTKLRKLLAMLMTLAMFISSVPTTALAAIVPVSGGTQTSSGISLQKVVKPPVATTTYVFMNGTTEFARQILKSGEELKNPGTPEADSANKEFVGWFDGDNQLTFPITASVGSASSTVTVNARFADVYFVFFTNEKGEVMVTKKGTNGETISTDGVTYPVGNEQSIVGWKDESGSLVSSVTLNGKDVTLTAKVENGHWITYDSQGGTYVEPAFVKGNDKTTAPKNPTRPGYTFHHWSETVEGAEFSFGSTLTTALTLYAVWTKNTNTRYTVIHWQENADDDEYSYVTSETKYGTTGAQTSAAAKSYTGFTAQTITQQTIAGDGSTIVNVYYKRNVYVITFHLDSVAYNCGKEAHTHSQWSCYDRRGNLTCTKEEHTHSSACGQVSEIKITAKYGANISDQWPTINGSSTWRTTESNRGQVTYQVNIDTMPLDGDDFWGPKTGSTYETAYYYVEVKPGETGETTQGVTYKEHHKDTSPGSGYTVTVEDQYPITGFTFNSDVSTKKGSNYNGAKFYYTRNSYNIVYVSNGQTVNTVSKKFEESISDAGSYTPTTKPAGKENYNFGGWYSDPTTQQAYSFDGKTMPAQNITVYAKWDEPIVNGKAHIKIDGTDAGEALTDVKYGGTITDQLNALQETIMKDKTGYTWRGWRTGANGTGEPFNVDTKIYSDITLYPYYTKDGTFSVTYVSGKDDVTAPTDSKKYAEDSYADLMTPDKLVSDGQYFLGWSDGKNIYQPRDKYQIKGDVTLTGVWGARPATVSLTYKANGGEGNDQTIDSIANNDTVTTIENPFTRAGYDFAGWDTSANGTGSIKAGSDVQVDSEGKNVLYAIWAARNDTVYTVEFYYQNTDGSYPDKASKSEFRTSTTDTEVSVTTDDKKPRENNQYVYDESAANVEKGIVTGDGKLVLKLYFKLNTATYVIHHYLKGTEVKVAKDETGTMNIGTEITAHKRSPLYAEYAAAEVAEEGGYVPSQTMTIVADSTKNVITVYYTMPLTITAEDAEKYYNGQPLVQRKFKVEGLVNGDVDTGFTLSMTKESTITNVGSTPNVIDKTTVKYNGGEIPSYYKVTYVPGTLTVKKAGINIIITGNNTTHVYDGTKYTAEGFTYPDKDGQITVTLAENWKAYAERTDVGTTEMGLTRESFVVTSENYDVTIAQVIDGYVKITPVTDKVTVTITENSDKVVYNGNERTVYGYKSMTADNTLYKVETSVTETPTDAWTAKGTNVGKYPVGIVAGDFKNTNPNFSNVEFVIVDGELEITPITTEIIITAASGEKTYDGTPLTNAGYTYTEGVLVEGDVLKADVEGSQTNFGSSDNIVTSYKVMRGDVDVTENYTFGKSKNGTLTVNKRTVTLTSADDKKVYDGKPLTNSNVTIGGQGFVTGEGATFDVTGTITNVGKEPNNFTYTLNEGTDANNYTITTKAGELEVTPVTDKVTVTIIGNTNETTYDGTEKSARGWGHRVEGSKLYTGADFTFTGDTKEVKGTNAGTYNLGLKAEQFENINENFTNVKFVIERDTSLTIKPRTVKLTSKTESKEYDGTPLTRPDVTVTGDGFVDGEVTGITATGSVTYVHEGEVTNTITYTEGAKFNKDNYIISKEEGKLSITAKTAKITITAKSDDKTYDGTPLTNAGYTYTEGVLENGDVLTAVVEGSQTDVGSSDNVVTSYVVKRGDVVVTDSYTFTDSVNGELKVTARNVTFTGESKSLPYTGSMQSITGIEQSGLVEGHTYEDLTYKAEGQNVGSYDGAFSGDVVIKDADGNDVTKNYNVKKQPGTLTITNAQFAVTFMGESAEKVYNGKEQSITGITVTGLLDGHTYSNLTYEAKGTDVGTYNGVFTGDVKIVDKAGTDVTKNYAITQTPGKLTITAVKDEVVVTITGYKVTATYNGEEHTASGYDVSINNTLYKEEYFTFSGTAKVTETKAGTYSMGLKEGNFQNTSKNFTNVKFIVNDGELVINKRPVKVTAEELKYAYNYANPVAHPEDSVVRYTVEAANEDRGLLAGDTLDVDVLYDGEDTQTLIGVYQAVAQIAAAKITNDKGDVTANYTIEKDDSTLTITGDDPLDPKKETTSKPETNYTVGDEITYTITVKNVSKDEAKNVVVTDSMAEIQDSTDYTVSEDKHTATIASIPAGGTVLVKAKHIVTAEDVEKAVKETDGTLTNVANIEFGDWSKDVTGDSDKLNDEYRYFVYYYWNDYKDANNQRVEVKTSESGTAMVGGEVTENPAKVDNYTPVSTESKKLTISADESKNVIEFYYYKNVELTANSATKTYDGTEKSVSGFTIDGENKDAAGKTIEADFSAITVGAKGTDVDTYPANFAEGTVGTVDATKRYIVTAANNGQLVITPITEKTITITAKSDSKTYDGTALTNNGFTYTEGVLVEGDELTAVVEGSATNVGDEGKNVVKSYKVMRGNVDVTKNYTFTESVDGKLTINPRKVTLTSETASKEYDGTPLTRPTVAVTGDGFVTGEVSDIRATGSVTYVDDGTVENTIEYTKNASFKDANYEIEERPGTLTITAQTKNVIVITTPTRTRAYNGNVLVDYQTTHTGTIAEGDQLIVTFPQNAGLTNAGSKLNEYESYRVIRMVDGKEKDVTNNYTFGESIIGTLTVTPVEIVLTAGSDEKKYDGTPLTKNEYTITKGEFVTRDEKRGEEWIKVEEGLATVTIVGSQTLVGSSANKITGHTLNAETLAQNYDIKYVDGELKVTQNEKTITITANSHTWEYDGQPHTDGGYTVNYDGKDYPVEAGESVELPTGDVVKATVEGTVTNVADSADNNNVVTEVTITNKAGTEVNDQYKTITKVPGGLKITQRGAGDMKVVLKAVDNTVTYDGQPHGAKLNDKGEIEVGVSYTITNLAEGHSVQTVVIDGSQTAVGKYLNELVPSGAIIVDEKGNDVTANYVVSYEKGNLEITSPDTVIVTIKGKTDTVEYDGQKHEVNGYDVVSISNDLYTKDDFGFADGATAHAEGTDAGDYFMNLTKDSFVNKNTNFTSVTFVVVDGQLTITKRGAGENKVKIIAANNSVYYDGQPHGAKLNAAGQIEVNVSYTTEYLADGHKVKTIAIDGSETKVGVYEGKLVPNTAIIVDENDNDVTKNYEITYVPGTLEIKKNETEIKVIANSHTWEYDGEAHSDGGYTVEYDGTKYEVPANGSATLPTGDVVTATVEGTVTNVADSADDNNVVTNVTITNKAGTEVNDQYKTITTVKGGLKITKRGDSKDDDKKVKIIAEPNTVEYDGEAHGAKLNAKGEIELDTSYTTVRLVDGHYVDETTLDITGSQTNVGVYDEELKPAVKAGATRIVIRDKDGNDVTDNYELTLVNATLTITGDKLIPDKKAEDEDIESNYKLGDKIEFTITVKNVSIYDVENVIVTDANAEIQAGDDYTVSEDKHTATIAIITAKNEIKIKALHTVTSEDILAGKVGNVANVKWDDGETTVGDDTTKLTPPDVTLVVTKTSDWEGKSTGAELEVGTKITYTIKVTNNGNVPATNVRFADVLQKGDATVTGDIPTYGTLGVGEENSKSFTVEYIVTEADLIKGSILNEVTANADDINYTYYVEEDGEKVQKTGTKTVEEAKGFVKDDTVEKNASTKSTKTTTSKPANGKGYALGETIKYDIVVTNDGNLTVTDVEVVDNLEGAEIKAGSGYNVVNGKAVIDELKPGESVTVKVEYVVTEADILAGKVVNDATVTGKGPGTDPEPDEPETEDPTDKPKATLEIVKDVVTSKESPKNGTSYALGEKITYTLTVKVGADNNVTVKNIKVTDTLLTAENVSKKIVEIAGGYTLNEMGEIELPDMEPGADEVVITYTYTVQESDLGSGAYGTVHNAAVAKGTTPDPKNPEDKPKDDPEGSSEKDTKTNIRLIITAKDNLGIEYDGDAHGEKGYTQNGLASGHEITSVTISGSRTNVGYYTDELKPSDAVIMEGNVDVTSHYEITYVKGDLEIIKRGLDENNPVQIIAEPNTVEYDGEAHGAKLNAKGEIELGTSYTTVRLADGHYVDETTLDITGSQTNVGVYDEELKPAVKAGATRIVIRDKDGNDVTDNYELTLVDGKLTITGDKLEPNKTVENEKPDSNYNLGDEIVFTITVKNVSIYPVKDVEVVDENAIIQASVNGDYEVINEHKAKIASIEPNGVVEIKAVHIVTSEDIIAGRVGNVANVKWDDSERTVNADTTKLTPPDVTLVVNKTSYWDGKGNAQPEVGTKITYTIKVTNNGNVPATNVRFADVLQKGDATVTGDIPTYGTLGVGEENSKSFTVEYIVTEADLLKGSILNEVFANADDINYTYYVEEDGEKVQKTGTKTVEEAKGFVKDDTVKASASFTSKKTTTSKPANGDGYALGETITYDIVVTNDGNLTLTDVEVTEELAGAVIKASSDYTVSGSVAKIAELKPGQTVTVKVEYVVTEADILAGSVKNEATVKGNGPDDKKPDPEEPGTEDPTDKPKATLEIVKDVVTSKESPKNGTSYALGEKITYTLTVKVGADNNVTVKNIKVTDTLLTAENVNAKIVEIAGGYTLNANNEIELPDMAPGATEVVITYTYTVQESDLGSGAYGTVHNAAVSKGTTPDPKDKDDKPDDPKDDDKKDTPTNIRLVITATDNTGIVYDGKEHGENGYTQKGLSKDHTIEKVTISGKRTNVGEEKLVPSNAKIVDKAGNDVTSHYDIEYVDGTLEIIQKKLTITADSDEKFYDGTPLTKDGYTHSGLADGDEFEDVTIEGSITNVGSVDNVASGAKIVRNGIDVTGNYEIKYETGELTIKAIPADGFMDVTVTKTWDDANNQDGKRDDVTLTLNASANNKLVDWDVLKDLAKNGANLTMDETDEHVFAKAEFTDDKASYSYTFKNVPKYANYNDASTLIDFAVTENRVPEFYEIGEKSTKLEIVNVHEVKTMNIHVTKVWDDEGNNDGYRPPEITVKLYADGELYDEKTITPDENDVWETTFEQLPVYKKGEKIGYTVKEDAIEEYTTTYSTEEPIIGYDEDEAAHEVTITNHYEIKKLSIKVTKIWADAANQDKLRPSELTFNLYKTVGDGEKELVQEFQLKSSNGTSVWKHKDLRTTLENLNVYENGEKIHYSIEETTVLEGYTVKYQDNDIVGGDKVNGEYQTEFRTWVTNYHIIKRPNRLIGPMGMTSGECVE